MSNPVLLKNLIGRLYIFCTTAFLKVFYLIPNPRNDRQKSGLKLSWVRELFPKKYPSGAPCIIDSILKWNWIVWSIVLYCYDKVQRWLKNCPSCREPAILTIHLMSGIDPWPSYNRCSCYKAWCNLALNMLKYK